MRHKVARAVSHYHYEMTVNITSSSDGPREHTEEGDFKNHKCLTQYKWKIRKLKVALKTLLQ